MNSLIENYPEQFINSNLSPCISLYQPTHRSHPEKDQDVIRFKNLVKTLEISLSKKYSEKEASSLLQPFYDIQEDREFWNYTKSGLVIFASPENFQIYTLQRKVPEIAVVADTFHIKPLIRFMQTLEYYQILCVNRHEIRLFEGNRDEIHNVELESNIPKTIEEALGSELSEPHLTVATYGTGASRGPAMHHGQGGRKADIEMDTEKFFRKVDAGILQYHSRKSKLPLILAALPEHHHTFHKVSQNPYLLSDGIKINPDGLSADELRKHARQVLEPYFQERLKSLFERYDQAKAKQLGSDDLAEIAKAAIAGRVDVLFINSESHIPGQIDNETGQVTLNNLLHPEVDDLLDDLGEVVLKKQGTVLVIPPEKMPQKRAIAAIYRF